MVKITDFHAEILVVVGEILRHFLGEGSDEYTLVLFDSDIDLRKQVVDLSLSGLDDDLRINKTGRTNDLFNNGVGLAALYLSRSSADVNCLIDMLIELVKIQRTVVVSARQAETVFNESRFSCAVTCVHRANLRQSDVTFVNYQQEVVRKVVKQSLRSTSRRSACKNSRVVLNAAAIADFTQHFHVIVGALFDSLSLDKLVVLREVIHPLIVLFQQAPILFFRHRQRSARQGR